MINKLNKLIEDIKKLDALAIIYLIFLAFSQKMEFLTFSNKSLIIQGKSGHISSISGMPVYFILFLFFSLSVFLFFLFLKTHFKDFQPVKKYFIIGTILLTLEFTYFCIFL